MEILFTKYKNKNAGRERWPRLAIHWCDVFTIYFHKSIHKIKVFFIKAEGVGFQDAWLLIIA